VADLPRRRPYIGRAIERARLRSVLDDVVARHEGRTIVIAGDAGIGKSQLIDRFVEDVGATAHVVEGACIDVADDALPYAPFVDMLRDLVRTTPEGRLPALLGPGRAELTRLLPELATRAADLAPAIDLEKASQARLFELLLGVFERLADERPLVVVIEDVHWADRSTRDLIAFLSRALRDDAVLVVLTERTDVAARAPDRLEFLAELEREEHVERIELGAFDRDEVAELAAAELAEPPGPDLVDRLLSRSDGNPFYLEALLAGLGRGDAALPPVLRDVLAARVAGLAPGTHDILRAAAAVGRRIDDTLLAEVLGLSPQHLATGLREAVASGILARRETPQGPILEFRHELLQEVVLAELFPGERMALHAELAGALEARLTAGDRTVAAVDLARHWEQAGQSERALPYAVQAGAAAERVYAFAEALPLWERAAAWVEDLPGEPEIAGRDHADLLIHAGDCALLIGEPKRAVNLLQRALVHLYPSEDPERVRVLENRLRWHLWWSGQHAAAVAAVETAVAAIPAEPPSVDRTRVLAQLAAVRMLAGNFVESAAAAHEALDVGRRIDAYAEMALAHGVLGWDMAMLGDIDAGIEEYRKGQEIAESVGSVEGAALAATNMAALLDRVGRSEASLEAALAGYAMTERLGVARTYGAILLGHAAKAQLALGRWDEADRLTASGLRRGAVDAGATWLMINRARVLTGRGQFDEAGRLLARARAIDERLGGTDYRTALLAAAAELATWTGHLDEVLDLAATGLGAFAVSGTPDPSLAWLAALLLRAIADASATPGSGRGRPDEALAARLRLVQGKVEAAIDSVVGQPGFVTGERVEALFAQTIAERGRVRGTSSPEAWRDVAGAWVRLQRPYHVAYARLREAEAIVAARGPRDDAAAALVEAAEIALGLGARPLFDLIARFASQARIVLPVSDAAGVTGAPGAAGTSARAGTEDRGPNELTTREAEVLRLVAEGWTNQQIADALFITRKTASVHVSNIMGKLGASNRAEAGAIAHRLGMVAEAARTG
jgi:DNA-binding CsgD family transcriptional regulator/tetratricopeptide (TPR) repeat protein